MNLIYITTLGTYAVRKEHGYHYFEVVELFPAVVADNWDIICGYESLSDAVRASEAMEKWELFGEKSIVHGRGVPKEDLPPHKVNKLGHPSADGAVSDKISA